MYPNGHCSIVKYSNFQVQKYKGSSGLQKVVYVSINFCEQLQFAKILPQIF